MARIRSIHPGQWTDAEFISCSPLARLLCLGLRNEADDQGVFKWAPVDLKVRLLPLDNTDVHALLAELEAFNQVKKFEHEGRQYGVIRNFCRFQRPKKPNRVYFMPPEFRTYVCLSDDGSPPNEDEDDVGSELKTDRRQRVPPKGEKSPQMKEGGGRKKDEERKKPTTATPVTQPARAPVDAVAKEPPNDAVAVIQAFDLTRVEHFGVAQARPWPNATDAVTAQRWLDAGATVELCRAVFEASHRMLAAKGREPPGSLKYHENGVTAAVAERSRPFASGNGQVAVVDDDYQQNPWTDAEERQALKAAKLLNAAGRKISELRAAHGNKRLPDFTEDEVRAWLAANGSAMTNDDRAGKGGG